MTIRTKLSLIIRLTLLYCLVFNSKVSAQTEPVIYKNQAQIDVKYSNLGYIAAGDSVLNLQAAKNFFVAGFYKPSKHPGINLGIARDNYWIQFTIENSNDAGSKLIVVLENPRLNDVDIFVLQGDSLVDQITLGDTFPFNNRVLNFNQFAFPVNCVSELPTQVFLFIKHKGNTLQVPVSVMTENRFLKKIQLDYFVIGITLGILFLTILFSLFFLFNSGNRLFLFYFLYILSIIGWLLSTEGYGFQYLWPNNPEWATKLGPGFSVLNLCFFILVALYYCKPYDSTSKIRKIIYVFFWLTICWGIIPFLPFPYHLYPELMALFLKVSFSLYFIDTILLVYYMAVLSIKKNWMVLFYFFAVIISMVSTILIIAKHSGWIDLPLSSGMFMSFGISFEIILMTAGITKQFYNYKREKDMMMINLLEQERTFNQKIIKSQEEERTRISKELHDDIGAGLTQIALMSEVAKHHKKNDENTLSELEDIAQTSRQLITSVSEIIWTLNTESSALDNLLIYQREQIGKQLEYSGMSHVFVFPEAKSKIMISSDQRRNISLIAKETINNIIKHSSAKNVHIEFHLLNNELSFTVQDDGIGFDTENGYMGNGLKNLQNRINDLRGTLKVQSEHGEGSSFKFIIPLSNTI